MVGFNSSVGILVVRTACIEPPGVTSATVSIPRSEFWSFGLAALTAAERVLCSVSIPRSEFWSFGLQRRRARAGVWRGFNSSVGILVVRTQQPHHASCAEAASFNSSVGILVVRT